MILKAVRVAVGSLFVRIEDPQEKQCPAAELGSAPGDPIVKQENRNVAVLQFAGPCYISRPNYLAESLDKL